MRKNCWRDGRGVIVPFADTSSISQAVCDLLRNETMRHTMRKAAYLLGRKMVWSHVGRDYVGSFERARHEHSGQTAKRIEAPTLDQRGRSAGMETRSSQMLDG